ncbi:COP1-interacting protein 7 [Stylosanthes scabra]|uniref:COP1-interacting protein 7 n=1 Tax=Stylosanthes scabra TaxID=79078 RepID=A0ABU6UHE3_9FABA|nr:COP1-interacting protein 7 [Stylosanthes scabra]
MYGMYLRGVWDYQRNRRCQDGRLEVYVKGGCALAELRQIRIESSPNACNVDVGPHNVGPGLSSGGFEAMDPSTRLDHTLFHLTPTRTRCDLVIAGGGVSERLASGLLEPFLSHLKTAKDQISKGGYSITLRPPSAPNAPWFTKATLQRFVRFVSTPEVLERIVTIEREIVQIENQSIEKTNLVLEAEEGRIKKSTKNQEGHEENSRVRLRRVLDNRKAMLCKEQAMAYARALVGGFYPESLDDLICFADAFGASRLREACINFLDLCKQKNEDKLWMDEIAAMQASSQPVLPYLRTSGIILAGEDDVSSKLNGSGDAAISESTPSHASFDMSQDNVMPTPLMSWRNHVPHYIHNFQGHAFQHMPPPYQGYLYPGMQVPSSYYPGNMQWPPNSEDSHVGIDREMDYNKSSFKKKKKKKNKHSRAVEHSEEDASTVSTDSSYESDSDEHPRQGKKKHGKKSSRKVVIRNINYITSKGDGEKGSVTEGSSSNEEFINGDSLKHQVEEAVGSLERKHKSSSSQHKKQQNGSADIDSNGTKGNNNWDAFQNLLLRDDEPSPDTEQQHVKFEEEVIVNNRGGTKNLEASNDSFIVSSKEMDSESRNFNEYFKEGKAFMKKKESTNEELLFPQRNGESGHYSVSTLSGCDPEPTLAKRQQDDRFIVNKSDKPANENEHKSFSMFNGVSSSEKNRRDTLADDSFMIQARSSENQSNSQSAADLTLVSDIVGAAEFTNNTQERSHNKTETLNSHEPDDLFMVLDRDLAVENGAAAAPLSAEMDYENNISLNEANRKASDTKTEDKKKPSSGESTNTKAPGVRNGKVSSKAAKDRPVNGLNGRSKPDITSRTRASPGSRMAATKSKSAKEEESRKRKEELLIQRQKRIAERSASKKTNGIDTKTSSKKDKPKIHPSNEETKKSQKPVLRNSTIERLATARVVSQKVAPSPGKPVPTKKPSLKAKAAPSDKTSSVEKKKQGVKEVKSSDKKEDLKKANGEVHADSNGHTKDEIKASVEVLPMNPANFEKNAKVSTSEREHVHENVGQLYMATSLPNHGVSSKLSSLAADTPQHIAEAIMNPIAASPTKPQAVSAVSSKVNLEIDECNAFPIEVPKKQIATPPPPPSDQVMSEPVHSRKKWNNDEDSSKAAKGFRKLLFFGRRS